MAESKSKRKIKVELTIIDADGAEHNVIVYRGKAKHMMNAQRMCGTDSSKLMFGLANQLVEINGETLTVEDWMEVDLDVWMEVIGELGNSSTTPAA